jgi:hypothetical protein
MTDETQTPEQETPQVETDRSIKPEDIKSPSDLRALMEMAAVGLTQNAQKKMQATGFHEAVQTELALHRGDMHQFALHRLVDLMERQDDRIAMLERLLSGAVAQKGKK